MPDSLPAGPVDLSHIIGQSELKQRVSERLKVARSKGWQFPHTLINADVGMGRFTIARAIATCICGQAGVITASEITKRLDLSGALSMVPPGGCLVLRNIDTLEREIFQMLIHFFEKGQLEIQIGAGPSARTHTMPLPELSIIATCANRWNIPPAVLSGFTQEVLDPYSNAELSAIASSQAAALGFRLLDERCGACAAGNAEATPGSINSLLTRVKRYAGKSTLGEAELMSILDVLGVRRKGTSTGTGLLDDLKAMSGVEFEQWTAALLMKHGYRVKPTRVVGDHGVDLEIERGGRRVVVQCKRWSDTVGEPVIREFYGSILNARADAGIFVTTSSFSAQARQFVQEKPITLLDLKSLVDLVLHGGHFEVIE